MTVTLPQLVADRDAHHYRVLLDGLPVVEQGETVLGLLHFKGYPALVEATAQQLAQRPFVVEQVALDQADVCLAQVVRDVLGRGFALHGLGGRPGPFF